MPDQLTSTARVSFAPEIAQRSLEYLAESSPVVREELETGEPAFLENLANLIIVSPPMLDSLTRHPEWIGWLKGQSYSGASQGTSRESYLAVWQEWLAQTQGDSDRTDCLRAFKRREHLKISFLDIAGLSSLEETIRRLSDIADCIITQALSHCWTELAQYRPLTLRECGTPLGFSVFAMGKLGGRELNYSSDVDLIFLRRVSDQEDELRFFARLGERLVHTLSQAGPEGALYRVDMRLRPYGETGPLVPSLASLVSYYESWGEAWERQALIKARFIAGDEDLGRRFADFVADFAFARQMDDSSLEDIKRVKHRSEKEHALETGRVHLKQGPGGIRDIEFYVQFLQLIGGERPEVRVGSTLEAIRELGNAKLLLDGEESQLAVAYRFLRILEHRLQLKGLTPKTIVPDDPEELALLARGLGFRGQGAEPVRCFEKTLELYRSRVRSILERVYLAPGYLHFRERDEELSQLLSDRTPRQRVRELLSHYGFQDIDKAWQNIRLIALGPAGRMLPPAERRAFLEFAFTLLEVLRDSLDPDQALHHLESFAAASGNRISFLRALASRRPHLERLANLLAHSDLCQQILNRHPEYFDSLARGMHILEGRRRGEMMEELGSRVRNSAGGEAKKDLLRRYRQRETIRIAYRDLANLAGPLEISRELSDLGEACVLSALGLAPLAVGAQEADAPQSMHVVALGKFGSQQLHYSSDLDLIFLYDAPANDAATDFRALIQLEQDARVERVIQLLAGITSEGAAYRVDLRLRPEGSSGLLARSWRGFEDYAIEFMQPWERMALVRSRILNARTDASCRWDALVSDIVYGFHWDEEAIQSIRHLKRRIETEKNRESRTHLDFKYGRGGIADLEFLVQFLQLRLGKNLPAVRKPSVSDAIPALQAVGAIAVEEAEALISAHRFQRHVENHYQLMEEWDSREISRESPQLVRLARSLGVPRGPAPEVRKRFLSRWKEHAQIVRALVEKYFFGD